MGYLLQEALKTLCGVNQWSYAAFWKIGLQNPKLLIWEDCYYEPALSHGQNGIENQEIWLQGCNASLVSTETRNSQPVYMLVNRMMMDNYVNVVGEGLIGRAAFSGNHQWILSERFTGEMHPPQVLKEVCNQFSAGMRTIAVVPVLPHGVVQLGSHLAITENLKFVNDAKNLVRQLGNLPNVLLSENCAGKDDNCNYFQNSRNNSMFDSRTSCSLVRHQSNVGDFKTSTSILSNVKADDAHNEGSSTIAYVDQTSNGVLAADWSKMEASLSNSVRISTMDNLLPDSFVSTHEDTSVEHLPGDDLFDVLGIDFKNKLLNSCSSNCLEDDDKSYPRANSDSDIFSTCGDHLLDAVVSGFNSHTKQNLEDEVSCKTTTLSNMISSSTPNAQSKMESFGCPKHLAKVGPASSCSVVTGPSKNDHQTFSQTSSIYESQISSWVGKFHDVKQSNSVSTGYSRKCDDFSQTKRKRLKPGENPRPRPKDRQMIQDRVKELREIIPNGAKCSIDALLERTIKHMLFMQSVTKHADKLKQTGDSKIISKDGGGLLKDDFSGGATWAYEVGSTSMVCPIIVEDLNEPRQMLVEMLCEEQGSFLEIADVIRRLGLTILKGLMESCDDKMWARFVVEANRDVTRMEVFISLVRLLDQTAKTSVAPFGNASNDDMMVHHFQEAASIPATGGSHC